MYSKVLWGISVSLSHQVTWGTCRHWSMKAVRTSQSSSLRGHMSGTKTESHNDSKGYSALGSFVFEGDMRVITDPQMNQSFPENSVVDVLMQSLDIC